MLNNGSHIAAPTVAIAYHSGFGHTAALADAVAAGARDGGAHVTLIAVDTMTDEDWDVLDGADAIVFGSATYMGNVSATFQAFAEQTGRRCMNGTWRDKVCRRLHELRRQGRRQDAHADVAGGVRRPAPHALGQPGIGRGLEQLDRQRGRPQQAWLLAGRGRADRCGRRPGSGASLRCRDVPPSRAARRAGDAAAQPRSSGFISCSIVGTSSLTVGWMCIVREIAV